MLVLGLVFKRTGSFCLGLLVPTRSRKTHVHPVRSPTTLLERLCGEPETTWGGKRAQPSPSLGLSCQGVRHMSDVTLDAPDQLSRQLSATE